MYATVGIIIHPSTAHVQMRKRKRRKKGNRNISILTPTNLIHLFDFARICSNPLFITMLIPAVPAYSSNSSVKEHADQDFDD